MLAAAADAVSQLVELVDVAGPERVLERAHERSLVAIQCGECSGFIRPTLVDAVVMAMASDWAEGNVGDAIVYTQDVDDMGALQARFPRVLIRRV